MSNLLKLKKWLTVPEAARHLSATMSEPVSDADIFRLALDGHLAVSIYFANPVMCVGNFLMSNNDANDLSWRLIDSDKPYDGVERIIQGHSVFPIIDEGCLGLSGIVDFPLVASQRLFLEREYFRLEGGPDVKGVGDGGVFFTSDNVNADGFLGRHGKELVNLDDLPLLRLAIPAPGGMKMLNDLPTDSFFAIRTKSIAKFIQSMSGDAGTTEKPLSATERNSLLVVIAALCKRNGLNPQDRGVAPKIAAMVNEIGVPMDPDTILAFLKKIPDAVGGRQR